MKLWKRKPPVVSPNNRIATPRFWHPGDAVAIVISLGMFAVLCGLRCG